MRIFPSILAAIALWPLLSPVVAMAKTAPEPARVMVFGTFHFANPGLDLVKSRVIDVLSEPNQAYLDGLARRLAEFKPTAMLVECEASEQPNYDAAFREHLDGRFRLTSNENHQVGFRVARLAGLPGVTCFDERQIEWKAQPMFDYMAQHPLPIREEMDALFKTLSARTDREQATLSLPQLLQLANDPARDAENKGLYLRTNAVGAGDGFAGADAAASWWHRNFRMYANIQRVALPGERVIVLAGQGHAAILKDLLAIDAQRRAEDVRAYLPERSPGKRGALDD